MSALSDEKIIPEVQQRLDFLLVKFWETGPINETQAFQNHLRVFVLGASRMARDFAILETLLQTTKEAHDSEAERLRIERETTKGLCAELADLISAVQRYDAAIQACANDPEKMASFCTAQGDNLDDLYRQMVGHTAGAEL